MVIIGRKSFVIVLSKLNCLRTSENVRARCNFVGGFGSAEQTVLRKADHICENNRCSTVLNDVLKINKFAYARGQIAQAVHRNKLLRRLICAYVKGSGANNTLLNSEDVAYQLCCRLIDD